MAITKPTDNPDWAESAAASDINNPTLKRPGGFVADDPLPSDWHNYLHRVAGRFARFTAGAFGTDNSKLTLSAENGEIILVDDPADIADAAYHDYAHITTASGGVLSRFTSQVLRAVGNKIQMGSRVLLESAVSTLIDLELKDEDGSPLLTRWVADALRVKSLTLPPGASAVDTLIGANLVKAAGSVRFTGTPASPTITLASTSHNISSVIRNGVGQYRFLFTTAIDTHGDFTTHVGRSVVATLGTDSGGSPDSVFIRMGPLLAGEVDVWVSDTSGLQVDLSANSVLSLIVL